MNELSRQDFAVAVNDAIAAVRHLYREVDLLVQGVREQLAATESLGQMRGTFAKSGKGMNRLIVRFEYGALFAPVDDADLEDDGDDDDGLDADNGDAEPPKRKKIELTDQRLLCLRIALHPVTPETSFEPIIEYAVMDQWRVGDAVIPAGASVALPSYMLKRIPPSLADRIDSKPGTLLRTRAAAHKGSGPRAKGGKRLSCHLPQGVKSVPLYELKEPSHLLGLAADMATMWRDSER